MENKNKDLSFFAGMAKLDKPTSVKGSRILMLLLVTVAFFVPAYSQVIPMYTEFECKKEGGAARIINDKIHDRLIFFAHKGYSTLNGKALPSGSNVIFFDKKTGKTSFVSSLTNAKHVYPFEGKLFFIKDSTQIWSYDLDDGATALCFTANDRIINFWNMGNDQILVNARSGGTVYIAGKTMPSNANRLAIVNYVRDTIVNITNQPYIFQAFTCGDWVVYLEGPKWFGYSGRFRTTIYNYKTGLSCSRSDFTANFLAIPRNDSTFLMWNDYPGSTKISLVNVNSSKNVAGDTFFKDDIFDMGVGGWAPPIVGNELDPASPIPYFQDNIWCRGDVEYKNLKTGQEIYPSQNEIWFWNLNTFEATYAGTFKDSANDMFIGGIENIGDRYVMFGLKGFLTTKLFRATTGIKNTQIAGLVVYPNPTTGNVNVSMPQSGFIEAYSVTGQLTFSQKALVEDTRVPTIPGLNIIRVTIGNQTQTFRVLGN